MSRREGNASEGGGEDGGFGRVPNIAGQGERQAGVGSRAGNVRDGRFPDPPQLSAVACWFRRCRWIATSTGTHGPPEDPRSAMAFTSPPAEKASPAPVSTTHPTSR